jgi:hypothetical protein
MNDESAKPRPRRQVDDPWNPCYGGCISSKGACWIRNSDNWCFSVEGHADGLYTLKGGNGLVITVPTDDLPELFRPT